MPSLAPIDDRPAGPPTGSAGRATQPQAATASKRERRPSDANAVRSARILGRAGSSACSTSPSAASQARASSAEGIEPSRINRVSDSDDPAEDVAARAPWPRWPRRSSPCRPPPRWPRAPAQQHGHGQRKLDEHEPLPGGSCPCPRPLRVPRVDALEAEDRILDDRQERVNARVPRARGLADLAPEDDQQEPEQRQAGDRLEHVRQAEHDPFQPRERLGRMPSGTPHDHGHEQGFDRPDRDARRSPRASDRARSRRVARSPS